MTHRAGFPLPAAALLLIALLLAAAPVTAAHAAGFWPFRHHGGRRGQHSAITLHHGPQRKVSPVGVRMHAPKPIGAGHKAPRTILSRRR